MAGDVDCRSFPSVFLWALLLLLSSFLFLVQPRSVSREVWCHGGVKEFLFGNVPNVHIYTIYLSTYLTEKHDIRISWFFHCYDSRISLSYLYFRTRPSVFIWNPYRSGNHSLRCMVDDPSTRRPCTSLVAVRNYETSQIFSLQMSIYIYICIHTHIKGARSNETLIVSIDFTFVYKKTFNELIRKHRTVPY